MALIDHSYLPVVLIVYVGLWSGILTTVRNSVHARLCLILRMLVCLQDQLGYIYIRMVRVPV